MDSATKTVDGVDIAWVALTFNVASILGGFVFWCRIAEEMPVQIVIHPPLGRGFTVSEHALGRRN